MRKILFCLMLVVSTAVTAASLEGDFLKLREAFRAGDATKLALYASRFQRHVHAPYAEYYQIRLYLETTNIESLQRFLQRHQGSLVGDKLRGDWLRVLGMRQQWSLFAEEYPKLVNKDDGLMCYALQLRLLGKDKEVIEEARSLWFTEKDMPGRGEGDSVLSLILGVLDGIPIKASFRHGHRVALDHTKNHTLIWIV